MLANIALNSLDWTFHEQGCRFVRYADDFVVLGQTEAEVERAQDLAQRHLTSIGLSLSAEKTKRTKFREGFAFLGFDITSWHVTIRTKSVEKFKNTIRELTPRHRNLDQQVIVRLNAVIRGTANFFATPWCSCAYRFRTLDGWIRMRIRCMKYKRKSGHDNWRMRLKQFQRRGLLTLSELRPAPA